MKHYDIPPAWHPKNIKEKYLELVKSYKVESAINFLEYEEWQDYTRTVLIAISWCIKERDPASIQIAIDFISAPVYFSYSGYIKSSMASRLKSVNLSEALKHKIRQGLLKIFIYGAFGGENKELVSLLRKIGLGEMLDEYLKLNKMGGKQRLIAKKLGLPSN